MVTNNLLKALEQSETNFKQWTDDCINDLVSSQQQFDMEITECNKTLAALKDITSLQDTKNNILIPELKQIEKEVATESDLLAAMDQNILTKKTSKEKSLSEAMQATRLYQHLGMSCHSLTWQARIFMGPYT